MDDVTLHANLVMKERVTYQGIIHQAKNATPGYKPFKWNGTKADGTPLADGYIKSKQLLLILAEKQNKQLLYFLIELHLS